MGAVTRRSCLTAASVSSGTRWLCSRSRSWCWGCSRSPPAPTPSSTGRTSATDTIGRANLDGTGADQSFITGASTPLGVAVDGAHVYWANGGTRHDRPRQPRRHGRQPELHHRRHRPRRGRGRRRPRLLGERIDTGTIGRADLDGTDVNQSFITGASAPRGWRSTAAHVYWANCHRHDRPRRPRRHRRRPELHHRRRVPRGGGRRRPRLLGEPRHTRSAAPTSTAPTPTRASSPAPASRSGWRGIETTRVLGQTTGTSARKQRNWLPRTGVAMKQALQG